MKPETFTLAHISDLHFSNGLSKDGSHSHSIHHLQQIESIFKDRSFDKVIVSGDLTNTGDSESLLRVKNWLLGKFPISSEEQIGLNLPSEIVATIPGNHDAYNCDNSLGSGWERWQKSIINYEKVFEPKFIDGCRYDWIEKGGHSLYIVYVDSCFLGDPTIEHFPDIQRLAISTINKIARGKLSLRQSRQMLRWFDAGMKGELNNPHNDEASIPKEKFARSFKILVMHHYLFEPEGCPDDFFLQINHRDIVFRNIALADFDMCLCGHKHIAEFKEFLYGNYFDKRARVKYLMQVFRRFMGIETMPFCLLDEDGKKMPRWFTAMVEIIFVKIKANSPKDVPEDEYVNKLIDTLLSCIRNPASFVGEIQGFVRNFETRGYELLDQEDLTAIQSKISSELKKTDRTFLAEFAEEYVKKFVQNINSRPFIQSMAGSAAKNCKKGDKSRSFNIYSIESSDSSVRVLQTKFVLGNKEKEWSELTNEYTFSDYHRLNRKIFSKNA
jgi:predicted phosphodiesterase